MAAGVDTEIALEAFGVRFVIAVSDPELVHRAFELVPPGSIPAPEGQPGERFSLVSERSTYRLLQGEAETFACADLEFALRMLGGQISDYIAFHAEERLLVSGDAVIHAERAILVLGPPLSGKTTLAAELTRAGATAWSAGYIVFDDAGHTYPYGPAASSAFETRTGKPIEVGTIVVTQYRPGSGWKPATGTPAEAVTALFARAVPARKRPADALAIARLATARARFLYGPRGEAADIALGLLRMASGC